MFCFPSFLEGKRAPLSRSAAGHSSLTGVARALFCFRLLSVSFASGEVIMCAWLLRKVDLNGDRREIMQTSRCIMKYENPRQGRRHEFSDATRFIWHNFPYIRKNLRMGCAGTKVGLSTTLVTASGYLKTFPKAPSPQVATSLCTKHCCLRKFVPLFGGFRLHTLQRQLV